MRMHPTIQRLPGECLIVPYARLSSPEHLHASYEMILPREGVARARVDGTEYAAEEIAGKSGDLRIGIKITENTECTGNFFDRNIRIKTMLIKNINSFSLQPLE